MLVVPGRSAGISECYQRFERTTGLAQADISLTHAHAAAHNIRLNGDSTFEMMFTKIRFSVVHCRQHRHRDSDLPVAPHPPLRLKRMPPLFHRSIAILLPSLSAPADES
jgi:hypothetical protein